MKQSFLLLVMAFTCGLIGTALLGQTLFLVADEQPRNVVLVVLIVATGLVFIGQWLVGIAEKVHANFAREK